MSFQEPDFVSYIEHNEMDELKDMKMEAEASKNEDDEEEATKCGDVFLSKMGNFIYCCYFCMERFYEMDFFILHVEENHKDYIIGEMQETFPESSEPGEIEEKNAVVKETMSHGFIADPVECKDDDVKDKVYDSENYEGPSEETNESNSNDQKDQKEFAGDESNLFSKNCNIDSQNAFSDENSGDFECKMCKEHFETVKLLRDHKQNKVFICEFCDKGFCTEKQLKNHRPRHTEYKDIECPDCSEIVKRKRLKGHEKVCSGRYETDEMGNKVLKKKFNPFPCKFCGKNFITAIGWEKHLIHHETPDDDRTETTKKGSLVCKFCGKQFRSKTDRQYHEFVHTGEKNFKCPECPKVFGSKKHIKTHLLTHNGQRPYPCPHCDWSFAIKSNLQVHIKRMHIIRKSFQCDLCEKRFVTSTEKKIHMRFHLDDKPYQCDECGIAYSTSSALCHHKRKHRNIRSYECDQCDKKFICSSYLKRHKVVHSDERPFQCSICSANFPRRRALLSHMPIHSDTKDYVCRLCGKAFSQYAGLYCHFKSHGTAMVNMNSVVKTASMNLDEYLIEEYID